MVKFLDIDYVQYRDLRSYIYYGRWLFRRKSTEVAYSINSVMSFSHLLVSPFATCHNLEFSLNSLEGHLFVSLQSFDSVVTIFRSL